MLKLEPRLRSKKVQACLRKGPQIRFVDKREPVSDDKPVEMPEFDPSLSDFELKIIIIRVAMMGEEERFILKGYDPYKYSPTKMA